jgi:hypothetical protein
MIPVEGCRGLFRDEENKAIVNCNDSEYQEYLKLKNKILTERDELKDIKEEMVEIKKLLKRLLNE